MSYEYSVSEVNVNRIVLLRSPMQQPDLNFSNSFTNDHSDAIAYVEQSIPLPESLLDRIALALRDSRHSLYSFIESAIEEKLNREPTESTTLRSWTDAIAHRNSDGGLYSEEL